MPRAFLAILVAMLVALAHAQAAQARFPAGITIDQQAPTFAALVQQAKPTLVFNHHDMLWITRDSAGHHAFTFNRAYNLRPGTAPAVWYLLESTNCWDDPDGFGVIYSRFANAQSVIVARDSDYGTIYQITWQSNPLSGSGGFTEYRNIFLLCDADHHWHYLADGPVGESGCNGAPQSSSDQVLAAATWDHANPAKVHFTFTMLRTTTWDIAGGEITPDLPSITLHYQMIPGKPEYDPSDGEPAAADISPGLYIRHGPIFLTAAQPQSFRDIASDLYHIGMLPVRPAALPGIVQALQKSNPAANSRIAPGEKIIVPENMIADD